MMDKFWLYLMKINDMGTMVEFWRNQGKLY